MKKIIIRASTVPASLNFLHGLLKQMAVEYNVFVLSSPGVELEEIAQSEKVKSIGVPMHRRISPLHDLVSLIRLVHVFRQLKPDVVHSITPKAGLLCMIAAKITRVPYRIHTFTGLVFPTSTGILRHLLMLTDKITCFCATHIIPEGEGVKRDLLSYKITSKQLTVLGFGNIAGVDINLFSRTPEVITSSEMIKKKYSLCETFNFIFVGRIVRDKGIDELIEAFSRLHNEFAGVRLLLVGSYEDDLDPINIKSKSEIKNNNAILYLGSQKSMPQWYATSNCLILPSYREGFPNVVLEAGSMMLPSIVTDINGSNEIIRDGYNGLIVKPHSATELYLAMSKIVRDPELYQRLSQHTRQIIVQKYERKFVQQSQLDYYKKILQQ